MNFVVYCIIATSPCVFDAMQKCDSCLVEKKFSTGLCLFNEYERTVM